MIFRAHPFAPFESAAAHGLIQRSEGVRRAACIRAAHRDSGLTSGRTPPSVRCRLRHVHCGSLACISSSRPPPSLLLKWDPLIGLIASRQAGTAGPPNTDGASQSTAEPRTTRAAVPPEADSAHAPAGRAQAARDHGGQRDNRIDLYYSTGWQHPTILHSVQGADWDRTPLQQVASSSGLWQHVSFPLNGQSSGSRDAPLLEFVVTDAGELWDKPADGGNYTVRERGSFTLRDGKVTPVTGRPVLVVSDLDDTMVGDDAATAAFKAFWEKKAVPRGSRLVYNTGRALDKWEQLIAEKQGVLAPPDALILSVGTKVYNRVNGQWVEDAGYAAQLDEDWHLEDVREATYAALAAVGRDSMHFRPPDEQNEHKVTCGVALAVLKEVLAHIRRTLKRGGVKARLITSGTGDWQFLDIVSVRAGKLEALEYVRKQLDFPHSATLACGDSGNDIDMLGGQSLAVVVGNAQPDLVDWLKEQQSSGNGAGQRLLAARLERADGILEALRAFGFK